MKSKMIYCKNCRKTTIHKIVHKENDFSGDGIIRGLIAVLSFGVSEMSPTIYGMCLMCGKINKN